MEDRAEALRLTEGPRHLAVMADSELRRRQPDIELEPLRSAEPEAAADELPAVTGKQAVAEYAGPSPRAGRPCGQRSRSAAA